MPKEKKINKKSSAVSEEENPIEPEEHEDLPDDVKEALGVKKKARIKPDPTDYIPELESNLDGLGPEVSLEESFEDY